MMQANSETVQDRETTGIRQTPSIFWLRCFVFFTKGFNVFLSPRSVFWMRIRITEVFSPQLSERVGFFFLPTSFNSHIVQCQGGERRERDQRVPGGIPGLHHVGCWPCWAGQVPISSTGKNSCNLDRKKCAIRVLDNQAGQVPGTEEKMRQLLQHSGIR